MMPTIRRNALLLALAIGSLVMSACSDITGPKNPAPKSDCTIYQGTNTCQ